MSFTIKNLKKEYVVYLTVYYGSKLPKRYIGSTNKTRISQGYNGSLSSKKYKKTYINEQENNKHLFKTRILSYHYTRQEALDKECEVQKKYNVVTSSLYSNMSLANGKFGINLTTPESIKKGLITRKNNNNLKHSEETKKKIGLANKGNVFSKEIKLKMSKAQKGKKQPQSHKDKTRERMLGNLLSEETKKKIGLSNKGNVMSKGKNAAAAKHINIYNAYDELMFECVGNYLEIVKLNDLPVSLQSTLYTKKPLYTKGSPHNKNYLKYVGWYAKHKEELDG